ncbi:hypothetical protein [Sphingobium sp. CFD-1]|uniref:hypothetical protein n=1 Tax=Sphingobium sp. CFD-1 TaxID=2878545 RepID=UPI00214BBC81|nr:hypothetical protein [Sphingobium sp. CFD-1]
MDDFYAARSRTIPPLAWSNIAPPFSLKPWLRDSHNFPAMMNFAIDPEQIDDLAAYMTTLQRRDYTPPIQ